MGKQQIVENNTFGAETGDLHPTLESDMYTGKSTHSQSRGKACDHTHILPACIDTGTHNFAKLFADHWFGLKRHLLHNGLAHRQCSM